jgi:thiol-disulfide isomerase/thioredoxin
MNPICTLLRAGAFVLLMALTGAADAAPERIFERDSYAQIRASHAGRALVVHLWGMTCGPCLVELPQWGALLRKRPELPLVLIQVDASVRAARAKRLAAAGLTRAENWSAASEFDEFLRASIDPVWPGDMPRTLLISPSGEAKTIRGAAKPAEVEQWLDGVGAGR